MESDGVVKRYHCNTKQLFQLSYFYFLSFIMVPCCTVMVPHSSSDLIIICNLNNKTTSYNTSVYQDQGKMTTLRQQFVFTPILQFVITTGREKTCIM